MLCAGLTVYSPLKTNGCGPGKKVGVVGIGGLGHYAIMFAKALGAEVYALTHSESKTEDAKELGADFVIDTTDKVWSILPSHNTLLTRTRRTSPRSIRGHWILSSLR